MLGVIVEIVGVSLGVGFCVEIDMPPVLQAKPAAPRQDDWQVRVPVTVAKCHAASVQGHCRINQRSVSVLHLTQSVQEVCKLLNVERVAGRQVLHQLGVGIVM